MKKVLLIGLFVFVGFKGWEEYKSSRGLDPIMSEPYVAVYGRHSCGYTQNTIKQLSQNGINYKYYDIDDRSVADIIHSRMEAAKISTRRYNLPVVDINGFIYIRPSEKSILSKYHE